MKKDPSSPFSFEEYIKEAEAFHGFASPRLLVGGYMVNKAKKQIPSGVLYEALCETPKCLPDAVQLLTPCTIGNGRLRIISLGRFALTLFNKDTGVGIRVFLDLAKLESWLELKACNLCAAVCPTGAITKDQPFDFLACVTYTYRDNSTGFQNWVEAMITSHDMAEYRSHFDDRETAFMWQSLMFRMSYRCSYCMAVCPARDEAKPVYLENKKEYVERVLKPLRDSREPVYVMAGSKAESRAKRNPNKEVRVVAGMMRKQPN
jgi:ferredoxin